MKGVWLVLGGGGAKGFAHLGVLEVLEEAGVPIDGIVGTSAGSMIGAVYAHLRDAKAARARVVSFVQGDEFQNIRLAFSPGRPSLLGRAVDGIRRQVALERMFLYSSAFGGRALRFIARGLVPRMDIQDLALPLVIKALDLDAGEEVLMREGDLLSAVVASSSVPGFFPPVERDGRLLCDAGIVDNMPVRDARACGAQRIVAVDLSAQISTRVERLVGMQVLLRAEEISCRLANQRRAAVADVTITPATGGKSWFDFTQLAPLVKAGEDAARRQLPRILALLD